MINENLTPTNIKQKLSLRKSDNEIKAAIIVVNVIIVI